MPGVASFNVGFLGSEAGVGSHISRPALLSVEAQRPGAWVLAVLLQPLKMLFGISNVDKNGLARDLTIRGDDHDVGIGRKHVDEGSIIGVANLHGLKVCRKFWAAQLELLYDVWDLLEP